MSNPLFAVVFSGVLATAAVGGGPLTISRTQPDLDRWNYPLNATPGSRSAASVFGVVGAEMTDGFTFDQRDAQFLLGFEIANDVAMLDCPLEDLVVTEAIITITVANDLNFAYDPTYDAYTSYLMPGEPDATIDTDTGRPLEMYGVGYRNGFDQSTYAENGPFGLVAWEGRNCFPIDFDDNDAPRDVSNNVSGSPTGIGPMAPFDPTPFAVGQIDTVAPGALVPANTVVSFAVDVNHPQAQGYLQDALASGELRVMVTSLQFAAFQSMTGSFGAYYTKENIFSVGRRPTLHLTIECRPEPQCPADFNTDGVVDIIDFGVFGSAFGTSSGDPDFDERADFNGDHTIDIIDFGVFGTEFGRTDC